MTQTKPLPILLTGIRVSGEIHLGNYLGAMKPAIDRQNDFRSFFFVADLHGLTTSPAANELRENARRIAAAWLACGLDPKQATLWKQSDVREHLELSYILACVTNMGLLERAHTYKDALAKGKLIKFGLFYYPVLMAADILLYGADFVPVGKDQAQHLEMARDMATFFNETYGNILKAPQAIIHENSASVPGTDGRKMSKSYDNGIDLFAEEKILKKQIMSIQTDSKSLDEPKVADECLVYQIYKLVAPADACSEMKSKLEAGGYGYGDAKKLLLARILEDYGVMRKNFTHWMSDRAELDKILKDGAERARDQASKIMCQIRNMIGL